MRVDSNSQDKHSHIEFSPSQALYVYITSFQFQHTIPVAKNTNMLLRSWDWP